MPVFNKGFSLIEVLIVVVIIGIISAIALPNYRNYVLKSNRSDGFAALNEIMQAQERYAVSEGTYTSNLTDLGYDATQQSSEGYYDITASKCVDDAELTLCVRLYATAKNGQEQDINDNGVLDPGDMTLDTRGTKVGWK